MIINIKGSVVGTEKKDMAEALRDLADQLESSIPIGPQFSFIKPAAELKGSCDMSYNEQG